MQISQEIRDKLNLIRVFITFDPNENLSVEDLTKGSLTLIRLGDLLHDILDIMNNGVKEEENPDADKCQES